MHLSSNVTDDEVIDTDRCRGVLVPARPDSDSFSPAGALTTGRLTQAVTQDRTSAAMTGATGAAMPRTTRRTAAGATGGVTAAAAGRVVRPAMRAAAAHTQTSTIGWTPEMIPEGTAAEIAIRTKDETTVGTAL